MQPGDAVVTLDLLLALGAFALRKRWLDSGHAPHTFLLKNQIYRRADKEKFSLPACFPRPSGAASFGWSAST